MDILCIEILSFDEQQTGIIDADGGLKEEEKE